MKKTCLLPLLFLVGCCPYIDTTSNLGSYLYIEAGWQQVGKTCVYKEVTGQSVMEWNPDKLREEEKKYISLSKKIEYGNTSCEKVVEAELEAQKEEKTSAIKTHFRPFSR